MDNTEFDLIVIGFGKAGKSIAMKQAKAGWRVALIERSADMYGGTCINIGCVPTKTLINATAQGKKWGEAVATRDKLISALNAKNYSLADDAGVTVIVAEARFTGPHEVSIGDATITAPRIVINTGAISRKQDGVYDSTTIQHIDPRPEHLAIVGDGPIGIEFASLFAAQGSKVTLYSSHEHVAGTYDEPIYTEVERILNDQGVEIVPNTRVEDYSTLPGDAVLLAAGRTPATEGLGLDKAGVELGGEGEVVVDKHLRTNVEGIWAAGDVNGGPQQTYVSYDDFRVLDSQFNGDGSYTTDDRLIPSTIFMTPPLSHVGLTEAQAAKEGKKVTVKRAKVAAMPIVPRPKTLGQADGVAQFIVDDDTDAILGATLLMVDSQELINTVALAMRHGISASELGAGMYTHPASSEVFNQLLG